MFTFLVSRGLFFDPKATIIANVVRRIRPKQNPDIVLNHRFHTTICLQSGRRYEYFDRMQWIQVPLIPCLLTLSVASHLFFQQIDNIDRRDESNQVRIDYFIVVLSSNIIELLIICRIPRTKYFDPPSLFHQTQCIWACSSLRFRRIWSIVTLFAQRFEIIYRREVSNQD